MKRLSHIFLLLLICLSADRAAAQENKATVNSLYKLYIKEVVDTTKVRLLRKLSDASQDGSTIKVLGFAREAVELSDRIGYNYQQSEENVIPLQKGDVVYLFSDGYADQFGRPNKKKFMSKQLKQQLIDNHKLPMAEQELNYLKTFSNWRGELSQVDDVLLFGLRI